jgi:[acyl-carrier-protein] S-malonyltransferase
MKKIALLFPGQGAQYPGMGKDFYQTFKEAREVFQEADDLLKKPLTRLIFEGDEESLKQTKNSQLSIFVVSLAILKVLQSQIFFQPFAVSGLSLGEYTAFCAAGKLSFAEGLDLISKRADFMDQACRENEGTMVAILGLEDDEVIDLVKEAALPQELFAANFNVPGQVVISGTQKGIERGSQLAKMRGAKKIIPLTVQGAFHSGLMKGAQKNLKPHIEALFFRETPVKIVMNAIGDFAEGEKNFKETLNLQMISPVLWHKGIKALQEAEVTHFFEVGCGKSLKGFNKRLGLESQTFSFEKVGDLEGF